MMLSRAGTGKLLSRDGGATHGVASAVTLVPTRSATTGRRGPVRRLGTTTAEAVAVTSVQRVKKDGTLVPSSIVTATPRTHVGPAPTAPENRTTARNRRRIRTEAVSAKVCGPRESPRARS